MMRREALLPEIRKKDSETQMEEAEISLFIDGGW